MPEVFSAVFCTSWPSRPIVLYKKILTYLILQQAIIFLFIRNTRSVKESALFLGLLLVCLSSATAKGKGCDSRDITA